MAVFWSIASMIVYATGINPAGDLHVTFLRAFTFATSASAAMLALSIGASAQLAPNQPKAAPPPAATTNQPGAAKAATPTTAPAKAAAPAKAKAAASPCKGLDEKSCKGDTQCGWIVPKKVDAKTGKVDNPYCRKIAGVAKTAADKKAVGAAPAQPAPVKKN